MEAKEFTISVFTEHKAGLLNRVVSVFTRRYINIESLNSSESSKPDIYRFTIVVTIPETEVRKIVAQLEKQVDVIKAFYYRHEEIIYQELALYKIPTFVFASGEKIERLIRSHNARILSIEPEYIVVEKTGHSEETQALLRDLEQVGIYEFVRSGRVAVPKAMEPLKEHLAAVEALSGEGGKR